MYWSPSQKDGVPFFRPPWFEKKMMKNFTSKQAGVSKNSGTPKSSILIGFSIINHPFWGTLIFGNTQVVKMGAWSCHPPFPPSSDSCVHRFTGSSVISNLTRPFLKAAGFNGGGWRVAPWSLNKALYKALFPGEEKVALWKKVGPMIPLFIGPHFFRWNDIPHQRSVWFWWYLRCFKSFFVDGFYNEFQHRKSTSHHLHAPDVHWGTSNFPTSTGSYTKPHLLRIFGGPFSNRPPRKPRKKSWKIRIFQFLPSFPEGILDT